MGNIVKYQTEHGEVALSPAIVRQYLVNGQGNVSDQEVEMFISLCKYQRLNPFLREAYLIKYGDRQPATIVTGKEVFTKRAAAHPDFDGFEAGVTVRRADGTVERREGSLVLEGEELIAGWARVWRKSRKVPVFAEASLAEYLRRDREGRPTRAWAEMPATMIRKVALVQALREAFPEDLQGLYDAAEMPVQEPLPERPVQQPVVVSATIVTEAPEHEPASCVPERVIEDEMAERRIERRQAAEDAGEPEVVEAEPEEPVLKSGKHAGKTISEVVEADRSYAVWYAEHGPNAEVAEAFRTALAAAGVDADDEERRRLLARAWATAKELDYDADDMHAIIAERYGKQSSKELTLPELKDLAEHLNGIAVERRMEADGAETLWPGEEA